MPPALKFILDGARPGLYNLSSLDEESVATLVTAADP